MFLSIIIPVFNSEKYLAQCLDSCLSQDLPADTYEIICVNDGSTDRSMEILSDYAARFDNIVTISKENEGCSVARNIGMELSRAEYIWFVDNDDLIAPNSLGTLYHAISPGKSLYDCFELSYCSFTNSDVRADGTVQYPSDYVKRGAMIGNALWPQIFRRAFIQENGLFHRGKRTDVPFYGFGMDAFFLYECQRSGMRTTFIQTEGPLYFYRRADHSITTDLSPAAHRARVREYLDIIPLLQAYCEEERLNNGKASELTANLLMDYVRTLLTFVANMPRKLYREARIMVRRNGYLPFQQPPECTASPSACQNRQELLHYYIITPWGMTLAALRFQLNSAKAKLIQLIRHSWIFQKIRRSH